MSFIEDGTGKGFKAKVDDRNRLVNFSEQRSILAAESRTNGEAYTFSHNDYISITTTDTETGILHVKNTSKTKDLFIVSVRTCGNIINKWKLYKNSTGGTLISEQTSGNKANLNAKSSNIAEATVYKGADGKTVSGGTMIGHLINDVGHSDEPFDGAVILGNNDSMELSVEVSSVGQVCCRAIGYYL